MTFVKFKPLPEMVERLVFSTDVRRPPGGEYRTQRSEMRVEYEMSYRLTEAEFAALEELIRANLRADWDVALWHQRLRGQDIASAATTLTTAGDADFRTTGKALIWKGCAEYELIAIDTVDPASVDLDAATGAAYSGAAVMPANPGILAGPISIGRRFPGRIDVTIPWMLRDPGDHAATAWGTYDGYQVLECASAYLSPLSGVIVPNTEYVDSGFGAVDLVESRDLEDMIFAVEIAGHAWSLREFWQTVEGRNHPFWVKAWGGQLDVAAALAASDTIDVAETRAAADMIGRHVVIDGIYREITGASGTGTTTLTLDSALGADVAAGAPAGLLSLVRADTDVLEIQHRHGFSARTSFPVIEERAA